MCIMLAGFAGKPRTFAIALSHSYFRIFGVTTGIAATLNATAPHACPRVLCTRITDKPLFELSVINSTRQRSTFVYVYVYVVDLPT